MTRGTAAVAVALAAAAAAAGGCSGGGGSGSGSGVPTATGGPPVRAARYALRPTAACLTRDGARVASVARDDPRKRALADLAQRRSVEVRYGRRSTLLAFTPSPSHAALVAEVLRVPGNPYVVRVRRNVVTMYLPGARPAATRAARCLTPLR